VVAQIIPLVLQAHKQGRDPAKQLCHRDIQGQRQGNQQPGHQGHARAAPAQVGAHPIQDGRADIAAATQVLGDGKGSLARFGEVEEMQHDQQIEVQQDQPQQALQGEQRDALEIPQHQPQTEQDQADGEEESATAGSPTQELQNAAGGGAVTEREQTEQGQQPDQRQADAQDIQLAVKGQPGRDGAGWSKRAGASPRAMAVDKRPHTFEGHFCLARAGPGLLGPVNRLAGSAFARLPFGFGGGASARAFGG
jgi:hypothetical protein